MRSLKTVKEGYVKEVAWDIETVNWSTVVSICGLSNDGESIIAHSFDEYLRKAEKLGWLKANVRHWAHYGGIFDHLLAWEHCAGKWLMQRGLTSSGFGLWACEFVRGASTWVLRDSSRVMPQSLASIGKAFGVEKMEVDRSNIHLLTQAETDTYCLRDCEVLLNAISRFQEFIRGEGAVMRDTLASTAATIIRLNYLPKDCWQWEAGQDAIAAHSYYGGRVERYVTEMQAGKVYDINSSYPAAMLRPLPTKYLGASSFDNGGWYSAHCKVTVPATLHIPPLPYRGKMGKRFENKLLFPSGTWEGFYAKEEVEAAKDSGCDVKVYTYWNYATEAWLEPFIGRLWKVRSESTDTGIRYITKILMNSSYGKMIEYGEYETITEDPRKGMEAYDEGLKVKAYPVATKKGEIITYYGVTEKRLGPLRHAAAASSIVSSARRTLYNGINEAGQSRVAYCDTDSVITSGTMGESSKLGEFKYEREFDCAEFLGPKLYALGKGDEITIKAKGFRLARGRDPREVWARLSFGAPIAGETTLSFKRQLGSKSVAFQRVTNSRQPSGKTVDKRCFTGETSRPWSITEIRSDDSTDAPE